MYISIYLYRLLGHALDYWKVSNLTGGGAAPNIKMMGYGHKSVRGSYLKLNKWRE